MNKKHVFKVSHNFLWLRLWAFVIFNENWFSFWGFTEFFESYGIQLLTESAMDFAMSLSEALLCFDWTANDC